MRSGEGHTVEINSHRDEAAAIAKAQTGNANGNGNRGHSVNTTLPSLLIVIVIVIVIVIASASARRARSTWKGGGTQQHIRLILSASSIDLERDRAHRRREREIVGALACEAQLDGPLFDVRGFECDHEPFRRRNLIWREEGNANASNALQADINQRGKMYVAFSSKFHGDPIRIVIGRLQRHRDTIRGVVCGG